MGGALCFPDPPHFPSLADSDKGGSDKLSTLVMVLILVAVVKAVFLGFAFIANFLRYSRSAIFRGLSPFSKDPQIVSG